MTILNIKGMTKMCVHSFTKSHIHKGGQCSVMDDSNLRVKISGALTAGPNTALTAFTRILNHFTICVII